MGGLNEWPRALAYMLRRKLQRWVRPGSDLGLAIHPRSHWLWHLALLQRRWSRVDVSSCPGLCNTKDSRWDVYMPFSMQVKPYVKLVAVRRDWLYVAFGSRNGVSEGKHQSDTDMTEWCHFTDEKCRKEWATYVTTIHAFTRKSTQKKLDRFNKSQIQVCLLLVLVTLVLWNALFKDSRHQCPLCHRCMLKPCRLLSHTVFVEMKYSRMQPSAAASNDEADLGVRITWPCGALQA